MNKAAEAAQRQQLSEKFRTEIGRKAVQTNLRRASLALLWLTLHDDDDCGGDVCTSMGRVSQPTADVFHSPFLLVSSC